MMRLPLPLAVRARRPPGGAVFRAHPPSSARSPSPPSEAAPVPYHPDHHRVAPWQVAIVVLLVALLLAAYLWSFRAGREQALEAPAPTIPSGEGALPAPVGPSAPATGPASGPVRQRP